jgi:regulatory protein
MKLNEADTGARRHERRAPRPLTAVRLEEMALAYVARFATSAGKLEAFLSRKLRERGWEGEEHSGEGRAAIAALVGRFVELGYVDDAGFARMRSGSLLRRGYGARRIARIWMRRGSTSISARIAPR